MRLAALAVIAASLPGCGRGERRAAPESSTTAAASGAAAAAGTSTCPATGLWASCSLLARLDASGLAPRTDPEPTDEPPLAERGVLVHLHNADLELFVYRDTAARIRAQGTLDTAKYVAYDAPLPPLGDHPTLIAAANVIAVLHSKSDHQRERVFDAITAGAPQPPSQPTP